MKNGPVLSNVLDLLNGSQEDAAWGKHISKAASSTHLVRLLDESLGDDLLSQSEKESLEKAWQVFGSMSWPEVVRFCHNRKNFPEWKDPGRSAQPIEFEEVYAAVGQAPKFAGEMAEVEKEKRLIRSLLAHAKGHRD